MTNRDRMNNKDRMISILNGKKPDRVPFMPFNELMPDTGFKKEMLGRGMGLILSHCTSVRQEMRNVTITEVNDNGIIAQIYHTPVGDVSTTYNSNVGKITGNPLGIQTGFLIKQPGDYVPVAYLLDNTVFFADNDNFLNAAKELGEIGITHAWTFEPPYMGAQYYLGLEKWVFDQSDHPEKFRMLLDALDRYQQRWLMLLLDCPDKYLINLGNLAGNFSPEQFEKHMLPYYKKYVPLFKEKGKITTIHADASNLDEFKELIVETGVDVIEAFTPPPFGNLALHEARKAWGEGKTIWINFPEAIFYEGYEKTKQYTVDLLKSDPCYNKFLSFTEMGLMGMDESNAEIFTNGTRAIMDAIDIAGWYN